MKNELTAKRLQIALSNKNMKPQELANKSGVSKASISQYINGSHAPSNLSSGKLAKVLNVSPLWLMGFDVPMHDLIKENNNSCNLNNNSHIGINIRKQREKLGLTQEELAKRLGYKSKSTINKIEMGINDISQSKIKAFAEALDTSIAYLMDWHDDNTNSNNLNDDAKQIAQFVSDNPEYKPLFDASCKVKKEDIPFVKEMIDRVSNTNTNPYDSIPDTPEEFERLYLTVDINEWKKKNKSNK
jgi:transcriptional regulator with XRE-family HTH domain